MMDLQPELEWSMRPFLIDFLVEVALGFKLHATTLHLAVNITDRYTSRRIVYKKHFQLLGCAALWIAAKYEEPKERVPTLVELRQMCCDAYRDDMFVQMESHILKTLDWRIAAPTCDFFLQSIAARACQPHDACSTCRIGTVKQADSTDSSLMSASECTIRATALTDAVKANGDVSGDQAILVTNLAMFACDVTLYSREFIDFQPETLASASLTLARHIQKSVTIASVGELPQLESKDHMRCVDLMNRYIATASSIIHKKFSTAAYAHASKVVNAYLQLRKRDSAEAQRLAGGIIQNLRTPPHTPIGRGILAHNGQPGLPTPPVSLTSTGSQRMYCPNSSSPRPQIRMTKTESQGLQISSDARTTKIDIDQVSDDEDEEMHSPRDDELFHIARNPPFVHPNLVEMKS